LLLLLLKNLNEIFLDYSGLFLYIIRVIKETEHKTKEKKMERYWLCTEGSIKKLVLRELSAFNDVWTEIDSYDELGNFVSHYEWNTQKMTWEETGK